MTNAKRVLVTGASGAVGRVLVPFLAARNLSLIAASRSAAANATNVKHPIVVRRMADLSHPEADWRALVAGCDVIVHLAGLAHGSLDDSRHNIINYEATRRIVDAALDVKVEHFVYMSSIAAQVGASSLFQQTEECTPRPKNAYGRSKLAAEEYIRGSGISHTILRPAAIRGVELKGSMQMLTRIAGLPIPLPFSGFTARRSLLSIQNFCSAVDFVLRNTSRATGTFVLADTNAVSVRNILTEERRQAGRPPWLFWVPPPAFKFMLTAIGKDRLWSQIGEPLIVNPARLISVGWVPVV